MVNLNFCKTYDHQIWQAGKSTDLTRMRLIKQMLVTPLRQDHVPNHGQTKNIVSPLPECVYGYQTWQEANLTWWDSVHKVARPFDPVVLQVHVTN